MTYNIAWKFVSLQEVFRLINSKTLVKDKYIIIQCDNINAIPYKDLVGLYLYFSGVKDWRWEDAHKFYSEKISFFRHLSNFLTDIINWPFLYLQKRKQIQHLKKKTNAPLKSNHENNRILFLKTDHWYNVKSGGSIAHMSGVINGFRALKIQVDILSVHSVDEFNGESNFNLINPNCPKGKNLPNMPEILYNDQFVEQSQFLRSKLPFIIYQRYSLGNYSGVYLKKKFNIPLICEYNGSLIWASENWNNKKLFHKNLLNSIELLNLQAADLIVAVSNPLKDELGKRGIDKNKILVNPNGVAPEQYSPEVDGSHIRSEYTLNDKTVIGFIGTFGQWHGAEILAEAFGLLLNNYPEYRKSVTLFMIGDGLTLPKVKEILARHNVLENTILTGLVPQKESPNYLAACDILASPHVPNSDGSPFFGSPTKLFEYMAMGKGIIASDLGQISEVLDHLKTALLVPPKNPKALMNGLKKLIDDPELRSSLGQKARKVVIKNHTWTIHAEKILKSLETICPLKFQ